MDILYSVASALGISPTWMATLIPITIMLFNLLGRLIPDTATGPLGILRKVAKVLGLYLSNRIEPGITVNSAAEEAVRQTDAIDSAVNASRDVTRAATDVIEKVEQVTTVVEAIQEVMPQTQRGKLLQRLNQGREDD